MKTILGLLIILFCSTASFAQQYDTTPPYLKSKVLPDFTLLSKDSVPFTQAVLTEGKSTIVMLFNPECEHCQHQLELLLDMPEVAASANLVLTATETLKKINVFYDKYHLEKYPWISIGKDHKYFFGGFYKPKTIPVLAFYNKEKQLVYFNQGSVKKQQILDALK
ncbi:TlpA family protein disulfide reductase [Ferruginibacter sp.]